MKDDKTVHDPSFSQTFRAAGEARDIVRERRRKVVPGIKTAVAVLAFEVVTVLRQQTSRRRYIVKAVTPRVVGLGGKPMVISQPQRSLERVVISGSYGAQLIDVSVGGKL